MPKAIVIGAGFGGIAAALRLRKKGYDVTIIDKQDKLGGRAYQYCRETPHGVFVHDAGPTVITAKFLFDELFELFGKRREDYVEFRDIYPWYRIVFAGGAATNSSSNDDTLARSLVPDSPSGEAPVASDRANTEFPTFDYGGSIEQFEAQIAMFEPRDVEGFRKYLAKSKKIFDKGFTELGDQPFHSFWTMLKCGPALLRLGSWRTVWGMTKKYIRNDKLRRVFSFQPLLVGGNPFNTTSIYSLIFYLERQWGVQFAMGGTGAIVRGLERLMREEGIEIRLGEEVAKIDIQPDADELRSIHAEARAKGWKVNIASPHVAAIVTERSTIELRPRFPQNGGDIVVANADAPEAWQSLIDPHFRTKKSKGWMPRLKYSMGLFVFYFGTTKQFPAVAHHTIVLGEAYKELLTKLFDARELEREDLSVYLHRPTATDPSMAPSGMDSFYVLVPVPNLQPRQRAATVRERKTPDENKTATSRSRLVDDIPTTDEGVIDWKSFGDAFRDDVIRYLERTVLPGLSECIVDPFYVTPEHFRDKLNTRHGSGFSIQPIFSQSAYFRFHNKAPGIEGLYFVGAGTHPGAGMPGVLCSAKVIDRLIPPVG